MIATVKYFGPLVHKNPYQNKNKPILVQNNTANTMQFQIDYLNKMNTSFYIF